ncbi:MAG: hypothetical protein FJ206_01600 [Gemmatimonadetes bacterium]|nr:hypothetical protein [Gemmatimonadota bacterium]
MCRLVAVASASPRDPADAIAALAVVAKRSKEYQGDGWGCAWWNDAQARWDCHHSIVPLWEDTPPPLPATRRFVAHARSAFGNEGIAVENNMPFCDGGWAFAFNGELRGVRLSVAGRIGAERLFRFIRRLGGDRDHAALARAVEVVARRTRYLRAMNLVLASSAIFRVVTRFGVDHEYFTMHRATVDDRVIVSSEPWPAESAGLHRMAPAPRWEPIPNGTILELALP